MSEVRAENRASRWRYLIVLIIFLLGILIGWLLAARCPACGNSNTPANSGAGGGAKFHGGAGAGERSDGPGADGPGAKGGGADGGPPNQGPDAVNKNVVLPPSRNGTPLDSTGSGSATPGDGNGDSGPGVGLLKADDFRYDKTGLPAATYSPEIVGLLAIN